MPDDWEDSWKHRSSQVWGASPAGTSHAPGLVPGTREFFEAARLPRWNRELRWLSELDPFSGSRGKKVLEVGCGVGFDAFEFCRSGADYTGIDITPQNVDRARAHLALYGWSPDIQEGDAENLPYGDQQFDVVFSNGVLHHTPDIERALHEAFRVLRSTGTLLIAVYHRHSAFLWFTLWLMDHLLRGGFLRRSFAERLARIEYTTSDALPLVRVYSRREIRSLVAGAGFEIRHVWVRKLIREDLPFPYLWRPVPEALLDRLGRLFGWYVILDARKP